MGKRGEELSPFFASIFPLFPQKLRLRTPVHVSLRNAINLPGTGNIFFLSAQNGKRTIGVLKSGGGGEVSNNHNEFV